MNDEQPARLPFQMIFTDDAQVLSMADADGLGDALRAALQGPPGLARWFFDSVKLRIYTVYTHPGDSGFTCRVCPDRDDFDREVAIIRNTHFGPESGRTFDPAPVRLTPPLPSCEKPADEIPESQTADYEQRVQDEMALMYLAIGDLLPLKEKLTLFDLGSPAKVEAIQRLWPQAIFEEQPDGRVTAVVNVPLGRRV